MNEAEKERIQLVLSRLPIHCLKSDASFLPVAVAVMEAAAQYTDMSGLQRRALVKAAMEDIVRHHVPALAPHLPLVEGLCDHMVRAARREFRFRAPRGFPCCRRRP